MQHIVTVLGCIAMLRQIIHSANLYKLNYTLSHDYITYVHNGTILPPKTVEIKQQISVLYFENTL